MSQGTWVMVVAVTLVMVVGVWRAGTDGRFRGTHAVKGAGAKPTSAAGTAGKAGTTGSAGSTSSTSSTGSAASTARTAGTASDAGAEAPQLPAVPSALAGWDADAQRGERATLLQFSSAFCAPCRATRRVLADVATLVPGVTHVEVDAEHHLDLVRALGILRTPTTLILDADGREVTRASGALKQDQVLVALAGAMKDA